MMQIDLNGDVGESFGCYSFGSDMELLEIVSSANIACGFHAGDPGTIRKTIERAMACGVALGAHPGLPDVAGFGRRAMAVSDVEVYDMVLYQIGALEAFVRVAGGTLHHVKPHGALYNMAARNEQLAMAIARAVASYDTNLVLVGLAGSELVRAGERAGLKTAREGFADRTYQRDGSLTDRSRPDALVLDADRAAEQAMHLAIDRCLTVSEGTAIAMDVDTICIHGDGKEAAAFASLIRQRLEGAGVTIRALFT